MSNAPPATQGGGHAGRVRVPEPRSFRGARDAKELENFLFDMEQYFRVVQPDNKESKGGRCTIDTWEDLKKELKAQFLPENVKFIAWRNLRRLHQQTGSIRDYVKQFSVLMLDIRDMSKKDKLFDFVEGLKPWAQAELRRQNIKDLVAAQGAAERLTNYSTPEHPKKKPTKDPESNEKEEAAETGSIRMGALRLLNALKGQVGEKEKTPLPKAQSPSPKESKHRELMYVDIKLNGKTTKAMVDTGATHNFIATGEAERLGLTLSKDGKVG
uniref:Retrotransposon gag domain-containing protein n=1 Tax=Ananas comosus var. bracteatus TaxID=296719 RepID=A0A6V7PSH6_ANACO|nr:unnamed protein product [Ananas comosus var. bracteatus]